MAGRVFPGQARTSRSMTVYDFSRCDVVLPWPWSMTGGGNRQRRRIYEAVGPVRTNRQPYSEKLDEASAWSGLPTKTPTSDSYLTSPFWELTKTTSLSSEGTSGVQTAIAANDLEHVELMALGGSSTSISVGLLNTGDTWGLNLESSLVIDGPGTLSSRNGALFAVTGLSTTQPTRLLITRRHTTSGNSVCYIYPGSHASTTVGASVKVTRVHRGPTVNGTSLGPYIKTLSAAVTTTDWPRTNLLAQSQRLDLWSQTRVATTQSRRRAPDGTFTAQDITVTAGGGGYVHRSLVKPDGSFKYTGSLFVHKSSDFCVLDLGDNTTGDCSVGFVPSTGALGVPNFVGTWSDVQASVEAVGAEWYRVSLSAISPTTPLIYLLVQMFNTGDTGTFWQGQLETGDKATAVIRTASASVTVTTPPFGEPVTVAADHPRLDYDKNGVGRGVMVERGSTNLISFSQPKGTASIVNGWTPNGGAGNDWIDNAGGIVGQPQTMTLVPGGSGTKYIPVGPLVAGQKYSLTQRVKPIDATSVQPFVDGTGVVPSASARFYFSTRSWVPISDTNITAYHHKELEDGVWEVGFTFTATASAGVAVHAYGIDGDMLFGDMQLEAGPPTSIMPTAGSGSVSGAESIACTDLAALGLDGDEWTVIVTAQEPLAVTAPDGYPMVLYMPGAGGSSANINKQPGGTMSFEFYDGSVQRSIQIAGQAAGTMRRYAIGFSRTAGLMRVGATGEPVQTAQHSNLTAFPAFSAAHLGGGAGWQLNGVIASVRRASRLLSEAEITQELKL